MVSPKSKALALILLVVVPILAVAPTYDEALKYVGTAAALRTFIFEMIQSRDSAPHYVANVMLSIAKRDFADKQLVYNWTLSVSGKSNSSASFGLAYFDPRFREWAIQTYLGYYEGAGSWSNVCYGQGGRETCTEYPFVFKVQFSRYTTEEWSEFGVLNAPMDEYATQDYYFWLNGTFAFQDFSLKYELPPGYRAGIDGYTVKGLEDIPANLSRRLPAGVGQVCSLRMVVMRDPSSFLPLVLYGTLPLFILWYVGVITLTTLRRREDRLKIYVGALFASFAYFLSLRQLLQTPVSWIELLAMMGMVLWIVLEAATIAFQGPTRLDS